MALFKCLVLTVVCIAANLTRALNQYAGDACILETSGESGVCVSLEVCIAATTGLKQGKRPQTCLFEESVHIVCCPTSVVPTSLPRATIPARTCNDPIPENAVKVKRTGQKAWDKCIDLAESVYPCRPSSFIINAPLKRTHVCSHTATPLIVGGKLASAHEFPHMAAVGYADTESPINITWNCGGSLISDQWVLTAAHCIRNKPASLVRLGGGDNNVAPRRNVLYTVILEVPHPQYARPAKYNDIGLMKLDRKVTISGNIRPACLHTGELVNDEKTLASGWGATQQNAKMSNKLLRTTLEKFNYNDCSEAHPAIKAKFGLGFQNSSQICYGHHTQKQDTCQGDSGGPLQIYNSERVECTYLIIGVTSFGSVCGEPGYPAIYTRVSAYIPWIEEVVWPDN